MNDYAFVITDGSIQSIFIQFDYDTYQEAKTRLSRKLADNWSIVENPVTIKCFIETESAIRDELNKLEGFNKYEGSQLFIEGLDLLINQHSH